MEVKLGNPTKSAFVLGILTILFCAGPPLSFGREWEYQLDAYYTSVDYTLHLTTAPIPFYDNANEWEIYKRLFSNPLPRFLILEGSVNPLPLAGVYLKRQATTFYNKMDFGQDQNIIQSVTTGFEEPAALSIFLGNVIDFKPVKKKSYGEGKGYIGYLLSAGNYHIKDNELIHDNWIEGEWKVKGDKKKSDIKLQWSFRAGAKFHANTDITDAFYLALRRSRLDYGEHHFSWLHNSGVMYKFDFDTRTFKGIQQQLVVDKKFPMEKRSLVPTLSLGFVYRTRDKFKGALRPNTQEFQVLLQPNIEF